MFSAATRDRAHFVLLALGLPLALIVVNVVTSFGGILLMVAAILWMGFAILVLGPLMGSE